MLSNIIPRSSVEIFLPFHSPLRVCLTAVKSCLQLINDKRGEITLHFFFPLWVGDSELKLKPFTDFLNVQSLFLCRLNYGIPRNLTQ